MKNRSLYSRIILTIIFALLVYYITIPAINLSSFGFYSYLFIIFIFYKISGIIKFTEKEKIITNIKKIPKNTIISACLVIGVFGLIIIVNFILSPLFNANSYSKRITIKEDANFSSDVANVNLKAIPLLDKDSSQKLGDRVMGQMPELVSQFTVSDLYTQINYKNDIVRVTPLEYADVIKFFTNQKEGVKGYITVNSVSGEAKLVKLDKGMQYMPSAMFNKNLYRHLRFKYPTVIFGTESFEIDNEGNPYWIIPTIKYTGVGLKKEITGVVILNPITGKSVKYSNGSIPTWVDHVYSAELIIEQVNDWGKYKKGFFNSMFGQKGVVQTTEGYNYTVMSDDVYLYTGITSASSDESNLGFILTNMRTKETKFYSVPGAEEYSAMASAEGQVQQMKYKASFPLLINLNNRPTYLLSLKDNAGLVKMYALVDVADYQKVVVSDASFGIEKAIANYLNNVDINIDTNSQEKELITIKHITTAMIDGNTYYYFTDTNNNRYQCSIRINQNLLPFLTIGSRVEVSYLTANDITEVLGIKEK